MKLKLRIILLVMIPMVLVAGTSLVLSGVQINNSVTEQAYSGLEATALSIANIFDFASEGDYHLEDGILMKGDDMNISESSQIVDEIKNETGLDVTIFYGDTRYLTTIVDENGKRQVGTTASAEVTDEVLNKGNNYGNDNVKILGERFICYYIPLIQPSTSKPVGMVFVGQEYQIVSDRMEKAAQLSGIPAIILLILSGVFAVVISTKTVNAINEGISFLNILASGKIGSKLPSRLTSRNDEIGDMCHSIQEVSGQLENIISELQKESAILNESADDCAETAEGVMESIEQISSSMQEVTAASTNQAKDADDASVNISHMGDMIENTNRQVGEMSDVTNKMNAASASVKETLLELSDSMKSVEEAVEEIAIKTNQTHESVQKINEITGIISGIATQTNLLSLNASIEAARAGEHGRGFAVVATEIQKLAEESNSSTNQIREMLEELQTNSNESVADMNRVKEIVRVQEASILKTNEMFGVLEGGIDNSTAGIKEISGESASLDEAREATVGIVQNVSMASQNIAAHMQETTASVEMLTEMAMGLRERAGNLAEIATSIDGMVSVFDIQA